MFDLNGTFFIFIGLFLLFMFLLNKIMLEPVGSVIEQRKARINKDYQWAQISNEHANEVLAEYQTHLHEIRLKSQQIVQEAAQSAQKLRTDKITAAQSEGKKRVAGIKSELTIERTYLLQSLVEPEIELVRGISDKLLGEQSPITVDKERVRNLLEAAK